MITLKVEVQKEEKDTKEDYKRFVKVQDQYASYNVPTKEEYEDYCGKVNKRLGELQARITILEGRTGEKTDVYKVSLFSKANGELELTGTEEQHKIFEKSREEIDKSLFPKFLTHDKLVLLALNCGLSVKKVGE